jgi:hypothetical protein
VGSRIHTQRAAPYLGARRVPPPRDSRWGVAVLHLGVALQVAFERQTLNPGFHLIGYRLWI